MKKRHHHKAHGKPHGKKHHSRHHSDGKMMFEFEEQYEQMPRGHKEVMTMNEYYPQYDRMNQGLTDNDRLPLRERGRARNGMMLGDEFYAGYDPRRRQERHDADMIHEDHHALANLPQQPIMRFYTTQRYMPEVLDDTIRGIDNQIDADDNQTMKQFKPHKY